MSGTTVVTGDITMNKADAVPALPEFIHFAHILEEAWNSFLLPQQP